MAVGSDALIEYKLIDGKTVNLNVNHIISIEKLSTREIKQQNLSTFGSSLSKFTSTNKIIMSSGQEYIIASTNTTASFDTIKSDVRATVATSPGLSGGRF